MTTPRLQGRSALITGGSRGIGLAIAQALAGEGCRLLMAGRDGKALAAAERKIKGSLACTCDVRDAQSVAALAAAVRQRFRRLDILINNAGISHAMAEVERLPLPVWREVIETDLTGMFLVTQAVLPLLRRGGAIVNNLSIAATRAFAGQSAYCAAKHGALGLTRALREELRPRGIRVIALMPGATATDIWNQFWPEAPRRRMLRPQTVAQSVLDALLLPPDSTVEEITLMPTAGAL